MAESVEKRLKNMIVERLFMKIEPDRIDESQSLIDNYGVDSVSLLELVVGVEEEFGIEVGDSDFSVEHFETVAALAAFVKERMP